MKDLHRHNLKPLGLGVQHYMRKMILAQCWFISTHFHALYVSHFLTIVWLHSTCIASQSQTCKCDTFLLLKLHFYFFEANCFPVDGFWWFRIFCVSLIKLRTLACENVFVLLTQVQECIRPLNPLRWMAREANLLMLLTRYVTGWLLPLSIW